MRTCGGVDGRETKAESRSWRGAIRGLSVNSCLEYRAWWIRRRLLWYEVTL